ncbi:Uncharacterised protein [Serratia rubidaea]|uniref:NAD-dependent epimerase/dehydratase domain-containing protein n=1 Tax=Serratia rubidaea TaxID=61652 RepID=A0A447QS79_SERRU|nr:Uncharacterised protein [Serratia rubidaea]
MAAAYGVSQFIHISSPAIYFDYHHHRNVPEDFRPARYANEFARSKAAGEQVIQHLALANRRPTSPSYALRGCSGRTTT